MKLISNSKMQQQRTDLGMAPRRVFGIPAGAHHQKGAPAIFFFSTQKEQNDTTGTAGQFMGAVHKHSSKQNASTVVTIRRPLGLSSACTPQCERS